MYNMVRGPEAGKFFHDKGRGNGYILTYGGTRIYISGDTEAIPEMRALKISTSHLLHERALYNDGRGSSRCRQGVSSEGRDSVSLPRQSSDGRHCFSEALAGTGIDVRLLEWYPKA